MPSNVTHRFVSPILWKLNQPLYSSAIQHVFAVAVVYTHRSVPPIDDNRRIQINAFPCTDNGKQVEEWIIFFSSFHKA